MAYKQRKVKKDSLVSETSKKASLIKPLYNPNAEEQIQVLLHLLLRAREKKLDILGLVWEDTDLGKSAYCDYFDLPKQELIDMLENMVKVVELS